MKFNFEATGVGSVPFKDPQDACRIIFENFKEIPFWPQLPKRSFLENMYAQYAEGLPGVVVDESARTIHIDTSRVASEIEVAYTKFLDSDTEFFRISEERAAGFYAFLELLKNQPKGIKFVKGQVTGPISAALSLTDQNKKSIIYDRDLFEMLTKVLVMKARWQIRKLKKLFPGVIIFIDEPYLTAVGSSYVNVDMAEAGKRLDEVISAIKSDGALSCVHCCGNTDWAFLLRREIDIISFDAYTFSKEFALYTADIKNFLSRGGTIAWGVVPSSQAAEKESIKALSARLGTALANLTSKGIDRNLISSIVTPSCGVGTLEEDLARRVLEGARKVSEGFK